VITMDSKYSRTVDLRNSNAASSGQWISRKAKV
jgi:hypothetical protein